MSQANGSSNAAVDMDSILDGTLDDIEDLPSFAAWPAGAYRVLLKEGFKQRLINDVPAFELKMVNLEVMEISNAAEAEEAPKVNDECSVSFGMGTETGRGFFKEAIKPFVAHAGGGSVRAAVDSSKGLECLAIMKRRVVKKAGEDDKTYATLVRMEIL